MGWGQWPHTLADGFWSLLQLQAAGGEADMPWYTMQVVTASATADRGALVACDMGSAVDDVTITAPEPVDGQINYFGVCYASYTATAKHVIINSHDGAELQRLYVEKNAVWFAYESSIGWLRVNAVHHDISFAARFNAIANYVFGEGSGSTQLADTSGNARHMTRDAPYARRSSGVRADSMAATFGRAFTRADAAFWLTGAASWELLVRGNYSVGVSGDLITCGGTGAGSNAANNINWAIHLYNGSAGSGTWWFRQQSGLNVWRTPQYSAELYVSFEWHHVVITRAPAAGGTQNLNFYLNGQYMPALSGGAAFQNYITAADGGASPATLKILAAGPNVDMQLFAIYGAELNAAQVNYLSRLRLGGRR